MKIKFNPQKAETQTAASVKNNILKYNNESINLNDIPNGATATNDFISIDDLEVLSLKSCSGKKSGNDYYFVEYISGRDLSEFLNQDSEEDSLF